MIKSLRRWMLGLALCAGSIGLGYLGLSVSGINGAAHAAEPAQTATDGSRGERQLASAEQLKAEAFKALRAGQFDKSRELLGKAAGLSNDPGLVQMASWATQFETQRQGFVAERRKQYDKAVDEVQKLIKAHKDAYVIDYARAAYTLADDKKAFRDEAWVDEIVKKSIDLASEYEGHEQWLKAMRLYSDLGSLEPANPLWKDKLKAATRRIRLLALYTPSQLKVLQEAESKDREEIDALVHPTTKPAKATTKPATPEADNAFKVDWHESLRGVQMSMVSEALTDSRGNYYRDISLRDMLIGGLKGIQAVCTTKGLETAFPNLSDEAKRAEFLTKLDELSARVKDATAGTELTVARSVINRLQEYNNNTVQLPAEVLAGEFADGAFGELDPFSNMIWPNDLEEFNKTTQGEFSGVGIQIQSDEDGSLKVVSPLEDSPAYKAGIKAGDVITEINHKNAKGISINQAVKNITGPSGTYVTLTIRTTTHEVHELTIKRETIKVASIKGWLHKPGGGWDYMVDPDQKIAYLRLTNFTKSTSHELDEAVADIKAHGGRAIILDLRYNPGGLLTAAVDVCDKFLKGGVIVSTHADRETPNPPTVAKAKGDGNEIDLPLIVLVNQYSASASEIVSGALKDNGRAKIIGERTFGKGSVQMLFPLSNRTAYLKLTTSHYYLPSGRCIHREENSTEWGVTPDVTIEMTPEQMRTAIDSRQEMDVLRDAKDEQPKPAAEEGKPRKDPLSCDAQLSAALLFLRLEIAGAQI